MNHRIGKVLFAITEETLDSWARQFFAHLTPACARQCILVALACRATRTTHHASLPGAQPSSATVQ